MSEFFTAYSYTILSLIGIAVSIFVYLRLGKYRDVSWKQLVSTYVFAAAGLLIGSHLLFFIVGLPDWIKQYAGDIHSFADFLAAFGYGASGLVFYGGLLGALAGVLIFCRMYKIYSYFELNHFAVIIPLFHAFGRIGCAINGCCYGIEYHGLFAITYTEANINPGISDDIADFSRFPIQPLEAVIELLIFLLLLMLYKKTRDRYSLTSIYLLIYSVIRFLDEFLRGDAARKIWGPFSTSQWISLIIFLCVIIRLTVLQLRRPGKSFFATKA